MIFVIFKVLILARWPPNKIKGWVQNYPISNVLPMEILQSQAKPCKMCRNKIRHWNAIQLKFYSFEIRLNFDDDMDLNQGPVSQLAAYVKLCTNGMIMVAMIMWLKPSMQKSLIHLFISLPIKPFQDQIQYTDAFLSIYESHGGYKTISKPLIYTVEVSVLIWWDLCLE